MIGSAVAQLGISLTAAAAAVAVASAPPPTPTPLPLDAETTVGGVPVACTGIGQTRLDPKWQAYGVRVEFANAQAEYLVDGAVTVRDRTGAAVLSAACEAPWLLMKLPPGAYTIEGRIVNSPARPRSAPFSPPAKGQMRLVLQFPDA